MRIQTKDLVLIPLFAAIISIFAQITIPIPIVPITGQTLAIGLTATILDTKRSVQVVILYILLGAVGLPVYAQSSGGLGILFGPTGGYLFSFIIMALIIGLISGKKQVSFLRSIIANNIGMIIQLFLGTIWLKYASELSWHSAMKFGLVPFILVGIIKAILSSWLGLIIRKRLVDARMISE